MLRGLTCGQSYTCRACNVVLNRNCRYNNFARSFQDSRNAARLSSTQIELRRATGGFLHRLASEGTAHYSIFRRQLAVQAQDTTAESDQPKPSQRQEREFEAAKNSAAGSLSLRPHSRKELEDKLHEKGYSKTAIARALDRLKELELQSDADYAEVYTRSKWRQARLAPSRIQQELLRKGVSRSDCQAALESVFGEPSRGKVRVNMDAVEDMDEDDEIFGTEARLDHQLLGSARRQAERTANLPTEARRRRLTGWLLRRGHDWDTVSRIMGLLQL